LIGANDGDVLPDILGDGWIFRIRTDGFRGDRVENAVAGDRFRADVREQREGDAALAAEGCENFRRIVADAGQPEALLSNLVDPCLQLDQLRLAVRSPVRGSDEDEHGALRPHDRLERPALAVLIS
jgi:hypothetical protein